MIFTKVKKRSKHGVTFYGQSQPLLCIWVKWLLIAYCLWAVSISLYVIFKVFYSRTSVHVESIKRARVPL